MEEGEDIKYLADEKFKKEKQNAAPNPPLSNKLTSSIYDTVNPQTSCLLQTGRHQILAAGEIYYPGCDGVEEGIGCGEEEGIEKLAKGVWGG